MLPKADAQQAKKSPFPPPPGGVAELLEYSPDYRTWTDVSGKFTERAKLVGVTGTKVKMQRTDRSQFTINLSSLSIQDRDWIKKHTKAGKPVAVTEGEAETESPAKKVDDATKGRLLEAVNKGVRAAAETGLDQEARLHVMAQAQFFKRELEKGNDPRLSTDDLLRMDGKSVRIIRAYFPELMGPE